MSLSSRIFVDEWKNARVHSVYKDNDRRDLGSYRSISILPIISIVFEREVFNQLNRYLKDNSTLWISVRISPSSLDCLGFIQMCDNWFENMENGKLTGVVSLDIRKAFDSIDHLILLNKVDFYRVSDKEMMRFKSHLTPEHNSVS